MRRFICLYLSIGEKNAVNGADLFCGDVGGDVVVGGGDDAVDAFGNIGDIRLSKITQGAGRFVYDATAKYPRASSRSSHKLNDGKLK